MRETSRWTYHFKPLLHWGSTLEVLGGSLHVELNLLLGKIDHVRGEQWLSVLLVVSLISIQQAIQPWEKLLGAVVGVKNDWNAICRGNGSDVVSTGNTTSDGGLLGTVGNTLS